MFESTTFIPSHSAKKGKPGTENVEQNDMVSQDEMVELLALTKELLSQNEDLAEESNRWVQSINVQVNSEQICILCMSLLSLIRDHVV